LDKVGSREINKFTILVSNPQSKFFLITAIEKIAKIERKGIIAFGAIDQNFICIYGNVLIVIRSTINIQQFLSINTYTYSYLEL
jgi:hypothetical protein